jgi:predicted Zn-dependent protease
LKYFQQALRVRPGDPGVQYQMASVEVAMGQNEEAQKHLEQLVRDAPDFEEAHVSLATVYYRVKRKQDGDRERQTAARLAAEKQAAQPGAKTETEGAKPGTEGQATPVPKPDPAQPKNTAPQAAS